MPQKDVVEKYTLFNSAHYRNSQKQRSQLRVTGNALALERLQQWPWLAKLGRQMT